MVVLRTQNLLKIYFENLSTLYLNDLLINFLMILSEATHYINSESYAFECEKLSFWSWKAMLSDAGSYAFGLLELCFRSSGAMLWTSRSSALDLTEHAFIYL